MEIPRPEEKPAVRRDRIYISETRLSVERPQGVTEEETATYSRQSVCERMHTNRASLVEANRANIAILERDIDMLKLFFPRYSVPGSREVQRLDLLLLVIVETLEYCDVCVCNSSCYQCCLLSDNKTLLTAVVVVSVRLLTILPSSFPRSFPII